MFVEVVGTVSALLSIVDFILKYSSPPDAVTKQALDRAAREIRKNESGLSVEEADRLIQRELSSSLPAESAGAVEDDLRFVAELVSIHDTCIPDNSLPDYGNGVMEVLYRVYEELYSMKLFDSKYAVENIRLGSYFIHSTRGHRHPKSVPTSPDGLKAPHTSRAIREVKQIHKALPRKLRNGTALWCHQFVLTRVPEGNYWIGGLIVTRFRPKSRKDRDLQHAMIGGYRDKICVYHRNVGEKAIFHSEDAVIVASDSYRLVGAMIQDGLMYRRLVRGEISEAKAISKGLRGLFG